MYSCGAAKAKQKHAGHEQQNKKPTSKCFFGQEQEVYMETL